MAVCRSTDWLATVNKLDEEKVAACGLRLVPGTVVGGGTEVVAGSAGNGSLGVSFLGGAGVQILL